MILLDIKLLNKDIKIGNEMEIEFINSYQKYSDNNNHPIIKDNNIKLNSKIKKKIFIIEFIGNGSYGNVFKILINNVICALKLSSNEKPVKMFKKYK